MHHAVLLGTSQISFKFILQDHNDQTFPYIMNLFLKILQYEKESC